MNCMNCKRQALQGCVNNTGSLFYCFECVKTVGMPPFDTPDQIPAHTVPFAYKPDQTVSEKFTVQILTPENPDYCGCSDCKRQREAVLRSLITAQLTNLFHGKDPFRLFPSKQEINVTPEQ